MPDEIPSLGGESTPSTSHKKPSISLFDTLADGGFDRDCFWLFEGSWHLPILRGGRPAILRDVEIMPAYEPAPTPLF